MTVGVDKLRHIVVLMMENRSFDHMLGAKPSPRRRPEEIPQNQRSYGQRSQSR